MSAAESDPPKWWYLFVPIMRDDVQTHLSGQMLESGQLIGRNP